MVKYTQTIGRRLRTNCLSVFDHFVRLAFKGLRFLGRNFVLYIIKNFSASKILPMKSTKIIRPRKNAFEDCIPVGLGKIIDASGYIFTLTMTSIKGTRMVEVRIHASINSAILVLPQFSRYTSFISKFSRT